MFWDIKIQIGKFEIFVCQSFSLSGWSGKTLGQNFFPRKILCTRFFLFRAGYGIFFSKKFLRTRVFLFLTEVEKLWGKIFFQEKFCVPGFFSFGRATVFFFPRNFCVPEFFSFWLKWKNFGAKFFSKKNFVYQVFSLSGGLRYFFFQEIFVYLWLPSNTWKHTKNTRREISSINITSYFGNWWIVS